ncbi:hypothetical protein PNBC_12735 [Paenibacillus crassostreae]|uniref:Uncharacterized protein n=1 Tax=Paenibacillus crassostreae TaxID=1763538 RepID=A0A162KW27_9BACL|nr:hypothetical protein LPB68_01220 [Paenibacillus crassostreae]OAB74883.1 hypothetical protein PNBC_12735 [Paenibacillus crassostreae]
MFSENKSVIRSSRVFKMNLYFYIDWPIKHYKGDYLRLSPFCYVHMPRFWAVPKALMGSEDLVMIKIKGQG